jgi:protein phosphatase
MVRTLNEDSLAVVELNRIQQSISRPIGVYVIADGMGGHAAGEVASGLIVDTIAKKALEELMPLQVQASKPDLSEWLRIAVEAANTEVFNLRKTAGTDMGSTMVAAAIIGNQAFITHIGDSRIYQINAIGIRRLTVDHSLVERLIATHQISREEARYHPQRNVIYRTVGDKSKIEIEVTSLTLSIGDSLLLCSDGLSGMVEDERICKLVLDASSPQAACEALIEAANAAGGQDNISVVIVKIVEP